MTEEDARQWLVDEAGVSRETMLLLEDFVALLREENERQNLVARSSLDHLWRRHIVDSAQLLRFAGTGARSWLDLGTGAGFPGLIVALLFDGEVTLVEARKLRVAFLEQAALRLGVAGRTRIFCAKIERLERAAFDVVSARAFAPLGRLFDLGARFSTTKTRWILPKGRNAQSELEAVESLWQGEFRLEPSLTDDDARIIVADRVRHRAKGMR